MPDSTSSSLPYDALIVGGSFAGLSAAMQLARARRRICVVDAGQPRNRFAEASHGFFGHDGAAPLALRDQARAQLLAYPSVDFVADAAETARVLPAEEGDTRFAVTLASGQTLVTRRLLLATGVHDLLPEGIEGLAPRWGSSVLHCPYCHGYEFIDRRLGVLGSGELSVHQAMLVADWGPLTLFTHGMPPLDDKTRAQLDARGITLDPGCVVALEGPASALEAVRFDDGRRLPIDALFVAPAQRQGSTLAAQLGCAFDEGPLGLVVRTDPMMKTSSVPGVFAAGDAALAMQNATLASADGVRAGASLHRSLIFGN
jgi:thioredoxin reductase